MALSPGSTKFKRGLWVPGGAPQIDWSNAACAGLLGVWVPLGEGGINPVVRNLLDQTALVGSGTANFQPGPAGLGLNIAASSAKATLTVLAAYKLTTAVSILVLYSHISAPSGSNVPMFGVTCSTAPNDGWHLGRDSSNAKRIVLAYNNGSVNEPIASNTMPTPAVGGIYCAAASIVFNGGNYYIASSGVIIANGTTVAGTPVYNGTSTLSIGNNINTQNSGVNVYLVAAWNRPLSPGELAEVSADPTALLSFSRDELYNTGAFMPATIAGQFDYSAPLFRLQNSPWR